MLRAPGQRVAPQERNSKVSIIFPSPTSERSLTHPPLPLTLPCDQDKVRSRYVLCHVHWKGVWSSSQHVRQEVPTVNGPQESLTQVPWRPSHRLSRAGYGQVCLQCLNGWLFFFKQAADKEAVLCLGTIDMNKTITAPNTSIALMCLTYTVTVFIRKVPLSPWAKTRRWNSKTNSG